MAFTSYLGVCSNNYAEIQAIKIGLKWCLDNGFRSTSWLLRDEIKKIEAMKQRAIFNLIIPLDEEI